MIETIYLEKNNLKKIENFISIWSNRINAETLICDTKYATNMKLDGLIILHNDFNINKEHEALSNSLDKNNIPTLKIDLSGTLIALVSSFNMWIELNKIKRILVVGNKSVSEVDKLEEFFNKINK